MNIQDLKRSIRFDPFKGHTIKNAGKSRHGLDVYYVSAMSYSEDEYYGGGIAYGYCGKIVIDVAGRVVGSHLYYEEYDY